MPQPQKDFNFNNFVGGNQKGARDWIQKAKVKSSAEQVFAMKL